MNQHSLIVCCVPGTIRGSFLNTIFFEKEVVVLKQCKLFKNEGTKFYFGPNPNASLITTNHALSMFQGSHTQKSIFGKKRSKKASCRTRYLH